MTSDIRKELEEINRRLEEGSFLRRLDMMFSVLFSVTVFIIGLTLRDPMLLNEALLAILSGILILLFLTLIGEFYAIIKDDVTLRFKYWMALAFSMIMNAIVAVPYVIPVPESPLLARVHIAFANNSIFLGIIVFFLFKRIVTDLFERYRRNLPSRRFGLESWSTLLLPTIIGFILSLLPVLIFIFTRQLNY